MKIITKELAKKLPKGHDLFQYEKIDTQNINNIIYIHIMVLLQFFKQ